MRRTVLSAVTVLLGLLAGLVIVELALRVLGYRPWSVELRHLNEPVMMVPDVTLGWQNRPGLYTYPAYDSSDETITVTILDEGDRRTREASEQVVDPGSAGSIILLGGSFTFGWAVSDKQTFAWKLQQRLPAVSIRNYAVAGFGTYQSLLNLQRIVDHVDPPAVVIYGFLDHHLIRNVAGADWLYTLERHSRRGHVAVPFVTLDENGALVRHAPQKHPAWMFREYLASVALLEKTLFQLRAASRSEARLEATVALMSQMQQVAVQSNAVFAPVILSSEENTAAGLTGLLKAHSVEPVDCNFRLTPERRVKGERHPNEIVHSRWADCIGDALRKRGIP